MSWNSLFAALAGLLFAGSGTSELSRLVLDGHEMHESLVTEQIDDVPRLHVPRAVLQDNPQLSTDAEFVKVITRAGSQGQLSSEGVQAALYALYRCEKEVGFYGLEAVSTTDADRLEILLRGIWAHNVSLDRAQVYREGKVLLVVWNDGVPASCWEAVNAVVTKRLEGQLPQAGWMIESRSSPNKTFKEAPSGQDASNAGAP